MIGIQTCTDIESGTPTHIIWQHGPVSTLSIRKPKIYADKVLPFDPRKMFDETGKLKSITELEENEAAAIAGHEFHGEMQGSDGPRKAVTVKFKFLDRLTAPAYRDGP